MPTEPPRCPPGRFVYAMPRIGHRNARAERGHEQACQKRNAQKKKYPANTTSMGGCIAAGDDPLSRDKRASAHRHLCDRAVVREPARRGDAAVVPMVSDRPSVDEGHGVHRARAGAGRTMRKDVCPYCSTLIVFLRRRDHPCPNCGRVIAVRVDASGWWLLTERRHGMGRRR